MQTPALAKGHTLPGRAVERTLAAVGKHAGLGVHRWGSSPVACPGSGYRRPLHGLLGRRRLALTDAAGVAGGPGRARARGLGVRRARGLPGDVVGARWAGACGGRVVGGAGTSAGGVVGARRAEVAGCGVGDARRLAAVDMVHVGWAAVRGAGGSVADGVAAGWARGATRVVVDQVFAWRAAVESRIDIGDAGSVFEVGARIAGRGVVDASPVVGEVGSVRAAGRIPYARGVVVGRAAPVRTRDPGRDTTVPAVDLPVRASRRRVGHAGRTAQVGVRRAGHDRRRRRRHRGGRGVGVVGLSWSPSVPRGR